MEVRRLAVEQPGAIYILGSLARSALEEQDLMNYSVNTLAYVLSGSS